MNPRNARRLLLSAFAISILIHLLGVPLVNWRLATPRDVPERMTISSVRIIRRIVRTPPPRTPAPLPTAVSTPKAARTTKIAVPIMANSSGPGRPSVQVATATATPSATPRPQKLPTPSTGGCVTPNAPAAVKSPAPIPDIPLEAREAAKSGIAQVHVRVSETGAVLEAGVTASLGSDALDQIAVSIAKASQYSPALQQCKPIAGTYEFRVRFVTP